MLALSFQENLRSKYESQALYQTCQILLESVLPHDVVITLLVFIMINYVIILL